MAGNNEGLQLQLLGEIALLRDGVELSLPASRKTRPLLAYLALNRNPTAARPCANCCGMTPMIPALPCCGAGAT